MPHHDETKTLSKVIVEGGMDDNLFDLRAGKKGQRLLVPRDGAPKTLGKFLKIERFSASMNR